MRKAVLVLIAVLLGTGHALFSPELEARLAGAGTDELIPVDIALKEQFDSGLLKEMVDGMPRARMREEAARILRSWSAGRQAGLLAVLESRTATGQASDIKPHWLVNMVYCRATPEVIRELEARPDVWFVQCDVRHVPGLLPKVSEADASGFEEITWGVDKINAPAVWALGYTGQGVVVGDIDTGCNHNHQDLTDHMWEDPNYPNHGYDIENDDFDPMDSNGHGTHTCGTVAGDGTAGTQCGVAPDAMIMSLRVRTVADSLAETQVWEAMEFVVSPPLSPGNGGDVITMSLGWRNSWDPMRALWRDGCNNTGAAGVIMIIAAGNERSTSPPYSCRTPGDVPPPWWNPQNIGTGALSNVISIGATDSTDAYASFSSRGPVEWGTVAGYNDYVHPPGLTRPDVSAPGVDVKSCLHTNNSGYQTMSGTSMATPHTAGTVALMLSKNPNLTSAEVDSILEMTSIDLGPGGKDMDYGAGRIDALAAVNATRPPFGVRYLASTADDSAGGNDDGIINPGEAINLPVWVINLCDYTAQGVRGTLRASDPNITITDSVKHFGNITEEDTGYTGIDGYDFSVAGACTNNYLLEFELVLTDTLDSAWVSGINLRCGTPVFGGDSVFAYDGHNGKLDPGEETDIAVQLVNSGLGNGYAVSVVLVSTDARLEVLDSTAVYGLVPADSWAMNEADHFRVRTDAGIPPEFVVPCTLRISQTGYPDQDVSFGLEVGRLTVVDPIPDGPRQPALYWAYDDADSFYTQAPTFAWVEISGVGTMLDLSDDDVETVNLPSGFGPFVYYGQSYAQVSVCGNGFIAPGSQTYTSWTNQALPYSSAPPMLAANWDDLYPPTGGGVWYYHDAANNRFVVEWDSVAYFSPRDVFEKFQVVIYDTTMSAADGNSEFVYQYLTANGFGSCTMGEQDQTKTIAIQALFDGSYHRGSSAIVPGRAVKFTSDEPIVGIEDPGAGTTGIPRALSLSVMPNPFRSASHLRWQLPVPGRVRLSVFDITGRTVRTLLDGELKAGNYNTAWDGRDNYGRLVANGTYLYKLETSAGVRTTKAVMLR